MKPDVLVKLAEVLDAAGYYVSESKAHVMPTVCHTDKGELRQVEEFRGPITLTLWPKANFEVRP